MVWIPKKHEKLGVELQEKIMKHLKKLSFGSVIFCLNCSWKCLVVDQIQPDFFINSGFQFQIKLEIPGSQNQYSGNKMRHEPVQSLQNVFYHQYTSSVSQSGNFLDFLVIELIAWSNSTRREQDTVSIGMTK